MFVLFCRHFTDMYMVLRTISYASCNNPQKISWICSANHPTYDSCLTIGHNPPQNSKRSNPCYRRYFLKELKCCPSNLKTGYLFASLAKTCKSQRKIHFLMNCRNLLQTSLSPFLCIINTYFSYAVGYYFFAASAANASKQAFTSFDSLATETRSFLKYQINW